MLLRSLKFNSRDVQLKNYIQSLSGIETFI